MSKVSEPNYLNTRIISGNSYVNSTDSRTSLFETSTNAGAGGEGERLP